ncbi:hypothetical protein [Burkholderia plantarii]|uniref:hypothetical protein n=1 Tax=Burkholderia plantarii TaxID=41899 RepID=UPI0018DD9419|nr:hypothetical protein [Burkholderia plantarii]MBI0329602.1 hypothetical protein [Burkholderia plantarii]
MEKALQAASGVANPWIERHSVDPADDASSSMHAAFLYDDHGYDRHDPMAIGPTTRHEGSYSHVMTSKTASDASVFIPLARPGCRRHRLAIRGRLLRALLFPTRFSIAGIGLWRGRPRGYHRGSRWHAITKQHRPRQQQ